MYPLVVEVVAVGGHQLRSFDQEVAMSESVLHAGTSAQIVLERGGVHISPKGRMSNTKDQVIPYEEIIGVEFRTAKNLVGGKLCVLTRERPKPVKYDDREVMFDKSRNDSFAWLCDKLTNLSADELRQLVDSIRSQTDPEVLAQIDRGAARAQSKQAEKSHADQAKRDARAEKLRDKFPNVREDVFEAITRMSWTWGGRQDIRNLEQYLNTTERVLHMVQGRLEDKDGILVLTDERLLFVFHGIINSRTEDFPLPAVSTISLATGFGSKIELHASGAKREIKNVMTDDARRLVDDARTRTGRQFERASAPAAAPASTDIMGQLAKLGELHKAGILTDEEFSAKKAELLARL